MSAWTDAADELSRRFKTWLRVQPPTVNVLDVARFVDEACSYFRSVVPRDNGKQKAREILGRALDRQDIPDKDASVDIAWTAIAEAWAALDR